VGLQASVEGSYLPPVNRGVAHEVSAHPPHTIISVPVHTPVSPDRAAGAPVAETGCHAFADGSYRPPSPSVPEPDDPPQTTISFPLHTAAGSRRGTGAFVVEVEAHVFVAGE